MSDIRKFGCPDCDLVHIEIDFSKLNDNQKNGIEPFVEKFKCENVAYMYRVGGFAFDLRVNSFKAPASKDDKIINQTKDEFKFQWGELDFENKLKRYIDLDLAFIGTPDEYYRLLQDVISTYVCGYFYPAQTSAGALGERILNRLLLKTRPYFVSSPYYKRIHSKKSFDNWDLPIKILSQWGIITDQVAKKFYELKKFRNDSIHYNFGYSFEENAPKAIRCLAEIINLQFNYQSRKDLFWCFVVPGEIWVRSTVVDTPFVKEFILPHCWQLTPFCEPTATPPVRGKAPLKPITDEAFLNLRKNRSIK